MFQFFEPHTIEAGPRPVFRLNVNTKVNFLLFICNTLSISTEFVLIVLHPLRRHYFHGHLTVSVCWRGYTNTTAWSFMKKLNIQTDLDHLDTPKNPNFRVCLLLHALGEVCTALCI